MSGSDNLVAIRFMQSGSAARRSPTFQRVSCGMSSIDTSAQKWIRTHGHVAMSAIE